MTVQSLEEAKLEKHQAKLINTLNKLEKEGGILFDKAITNKRLKIGRYHDDRWPAPKADLLFGQAQGLDGKFFPAHAVKRQAYTDMHCVQFIKAYTATKLGLSSTQVRQHNQAAKLVLHIAYNSVEGFATLTKTKIEDFMRAYQQAGGGSANGIENKIAGEGGLICWMRRNEMLLTPFKYSCVLPDKHKLAAHDATSPQAAEKVNNKRPPSNLDTALGEVLLKTDGGKNEPKEGYFRLRALVCSFMMAAGLRVGEATTLSIDCFHEVDGKTWLKVLSEKVGEPRLVPLGAGWETLLKQRHKEILQLTQTARHAAMALEDGTLYEQLREQLEAIAKNRKTSDRYRNHQYLLDPASGFFKWGEYVQAGLLPRFSERGKKHDTLVATGEQVLRGAKSLWIAFDAFESWAAEQHHSVLSDHYNTALTDLALDDPTLELAGYSTKLLLSNHLFIKLDQQFHRGRPTRTHVPLPISHGDIQQFLRTAGKTLSAFEALNIRNPDGTLFELRDKVSTHIFRHWKEDARFRAGGNEMAIALLGGRTPGQTRAYDKRTAAETAEQHRDLYMQLVPDSLPKDALGKRVKKMLKVGASEREIQAVVEEALAIMHLTPWGGCSRDLEIGPCPKHYKCLRGFDEQSENDDACANFHIDPADPVAKANIEHTLRVAKYQLGALARLTSEEAISETLEGIQMDYSPEQGHSLLAMQVKHQTEIIKGCEAALRAYQSNSAGKHENRHGTRLRQVASVDRIHAVSLIDPSEMQS